MDVPTIKGVAIRSAVQDLASLLDSDRVPAAVAVRKLGDAEREMLSTGVQDDSWYPLASYDRICRLLLEYDGRGQADYFVRRGRAVADRLIAAGAFKQVDVLRRIDGDTSYEQAALYMRVAGTIWNTVFSFASFRLLDDDVNYGFEVTGAEPISDMLAESILGFMIRLSEEAEGRPVEVSHSRPTEDLLCYHFRFGPPGPRASRHPRAR